MDAVLSGDGILCFALMPQISLKPCIYNIILYYEYIPSSVTTGGSLVKIFHCSFRGVSESSPSSCCRPPTVNVAVNGYQIICAGEPEEAG